MTACADYAEVYELDIRPRRRRRVLKLFAHVVWAGLFLIRPRLALRIWHERGA